MRTMKCLSEVRMCGRFPSTRSKNEVALWNETKIDKESMKCSEHLLFKTLKNAPVWHFVR